jgi:ACGX-repeat protein
MTAQSILNDEKNENTQAACGTACGASDDTQNEEVKESTACGTACGASDDEVKKEEPTACGTACGAGE